MKNMKFWRTALVATLVLTVMLSVTGGTIAWFTDTVTTGENTIKSGNLDLALEYKTNLNDAWAPVTETTKLFKEDALYEPGYTEVVFLRVVNAGNLALKYIMGVDVVNTAIGESVEGNAIELSDYMQIGAHVMDESLGQYLLPGMFDTREEAISYISGVDGTGFIDLNDEDTVLVLDEDPQRVLPEQNYAQLITLVLHMPTTVGNEANHVTGTTVPQMDITLNFEATQAMEEEDSFNNAEYDEDALFPSEIGTAADLKAALQAGENVKLAADIDMGDEQIKIPAGVNVVVDLNGNDLTGDYNGTDHYALFTIPNGASLTINGEGEVKAETESTADNRSLALFYNAGELTINGGTYNMSNVRNGHTWIISTIVDNRTNNASCNAKLTINGGDFSVSGDAINLFRNYPQQGGTATIVINDGNFHSDNGAKTYIWNQEAGSHLGELYFNGGTYDAGVVYEDYNGQNDIHIADGVIIGAYEGNN